MGMFDKVWVTCPHCGEKQEQQSKSAAYPNLRNYDEEAVDAEVVSGIIGSAFCSPDDHPVGCGQIFYINALPVKVFTTKIKVNNDGS
jgi:hypothetical protein